MRRFECIGRAIVMLALLGMSLGASAQGFPTRPIRLVVPDAPGGSPDQLGRLLAQKMSETIGQQVIVDNRPGAAGVLAADIVSKSPPDGYTLLITTTSIYAIIPGLRKDLQYDPFKDFIPISRIATASNVLVVNDALPVKSVADLVRLAKEKPGALNYASAGVGSPAHLAGEMLNQLAGIKLTHVPYKGAAPGLLDVIAGNAQLMITSPIAAAAHMNSGKVRALATTGATRNPVLPSLPTIADTVPGYDISQSWGIVAPAGTPPDVIKHLSDEIVKAMSDPAVKERVLKTGAVPVGDLPADFAAFMRQERTRLTDVITKSNIVLTE
ncbi:MAG TPA: tripartite tricarboxylate transporter substrate binding protein [Casimicrobiaceae bacterium]|nr:tripartite tricarboxylate transporter substrate binding protein [Casimicrobiaceae bacterium]